MKKFLIITGIITIFTLSISKKIIANNRYSGENIPRFVSTRFDKIKSYVGPNTKYPIKYTYNYKNTPLKVINEFYNWRQVEDIDDKKSWIHVNDLTSIKTAMITKNTILFDDNNLQGQQTAKLQPNVIFKIKNCKDHFCYGEIEHKNSKLKGYILQKYLWGI